MLRTKTCVTIISTLAALACSPAVRAAVYPRMYWSDRVADTIQVADADGSNLEVIVSGLGEPRGIDVDFVNGKVYWADNGTNKIQRANLDGTQIEDLVTDDLNFPAGVALDVEGGKIYWADRSNHKIQRADLDGSQVEDLVVDLGSPYYISLDLTSRQMYWTDFGTDKIQRANLDGTMVEDLVTTGLVLTRGIALDLDGGKMYWADRGTDKLQRANLDGSQIEDLVTIVPPPRVDSAPHGVALDVANGHMYWVDNGTVKIQRANLDGTNVVDILTADNSNLERPWQIVLELGPFTQLVPLQSGDANRDLSFDQQDIIQVAQANRYLTGQPATWAQGDWNGAPGGQVDNPPAGDGLFDQNDVIAALSHGLYLSGPYGALLPGGEENDRQTSVGYDARTGEVWVDAPAGVALTSINIDSDSGIFRGEPADNLGGSFDNSSVDNIFKATFGSSFAALSFGKVAQAGLSEQFVLTDLSVIGSLDGGGALGDVDLIYIPVPEPSTMALAVFSLLGWLWVPRFFGKWGVPRGF